MIRFIHAADAHIDSPLKGPNRMTGPLLMSSAAQHDGLSGI